MDFQLINHPHYLLVLNAVQLVTHLTITTVCIGWLNVDKFALAESPSTTQVAEMNDQSTHSTLVTLRSVTLAHMYILSAVLVPMCAVCVAHVPGPGTPTTSVYHCTVHTCTVVDRLANLSRHYRPRDPTTGLYDV